MSDAQPTRFPLIDRYMGLRMEVELETVSPGELVVVESRRRLRNELSYGFIHALWCLWIEDGRFAASVVPGLGAAVRPFLSVLTDAARLHDPALVSDVQIAMDEGLQASGLWATDGSPRRSLAFACNARLLRRHHHGDCRRLTDDGVPPAEGLTLPRHCFGDGVVYGVVDDGLVVSIAFAHRTGVMENEVVDLGVDTAPAFRGRGFAKACVSAVVEHITRTGGEARYACSPTNAGSIATARSVGFVPYGRQLSLAATELQPG